MSTPHHPVVSWQDNDLLISAGSSWLTINRGDDSCRLRGLENLGEIARLLDQVLRYGKDGACCLDGLNWAAGPKDEGVALYHNGTLLGLCSGSARHLSTWLHHACGVTLPDCDGLSGITIESLSSLITLGAAGWTLSLTRAEAACLGRRLCAFAGSRGYFLPDSEDALSPHITSTSCEDFTLDLGSRGSLTLETRHKGTFKLTVGTGAESGRPLFIVGLTILGRALERLARGERGGDEYVRPRHRRGEMYGESQLALAFACEHPCPGCRDISTSGHGCDNEERCIAWEVFQAL